MSRMERACPNGSLSAIAPQGDSWVTPTPEEGWSLAVEQECSLHHERRLLYSSWLDRGAAAAMIDP